MLHRQIASLIAQCVVAFLTACTPNNALMPTPAIYEGPAGRPIYAGALAANPPHMLDLLYVTDREPITGPQGQLAYGTSRSRVMTFGSISLAIEGGDGKAGGAANHGRFKLGTPRLIGAFPKTPYGVEKVAGGFRRDPVAVEQHEAAVSALQAEVSRRLANAERKEVVIFVHGYANKFDDAAYSTGNICRSLGAEFVCIVLSWPAGGSGGILFGYNVDRESGEFAVADMRKAIRAIGETKVSRDCT